MHGREGDDTRKLIRHMCSVPLTRKTTVAGVIDSNGSSLSSFYKDNRKISVGDCALFKPAKDSPPFVGLIRCLTSEKDSNLKLRVNWLYRPAEVKLSKGVALEAALNEVFYSFHSDEIPAASLLHPCKVAFLRKGVELPPGVCSFVCRRVYDITNKCLWWLTDQDYIDDRQEEVDQLLYKTRMKMRASKEEQQGPHSPKPVNGSAASSPLKHSPDSLQNSSSNLSSHRRGKRERGEQSFEAIKRERSLRPDDGDSVQVRSESLLNLEITKFCEKGGLVDSEAVARLVRLMQPEKSAKKIDLTGRSMLAETIAATDKLDCLNQFIQLRGLVVLNEWLQEVHKGKIGDSGNFKSSDKSVDDFLLVLFRALDKLPVNLDALRMSNIGKSVNHLRTHKNSDIQKKARSLVDTWKKRVAAEIINDTKPVSSQAIQWPGRSQHDNSHGGKRHSSGSDAAIRSSITHYSVKSASVKLMPGESNSKFTSANPGVAKATLSPTSTIDKCDYKDGQSRMTANGGSSDPLTVAREEKSSSSSHSHTNSQCSSDQRKNLVPCGKEETRRSTAASKSLNKTAGSVSKHRKSANGPSSGVHRETTSNRSSSVVKHSAVEKELNSAADASGQESNNHKLIVKIPNRGRGLTQNIAGGSLEDSSCRSSRASSPALSEKHDQSDSILKGNKHDIHQLPEVDGPSTSVPQRTSETRRLQTSSKIPCSPSRNEIKSRKTHDPSFSSMNALIESCAKFSEADVPRSAGDDVGMNLLASVAAGEISKSGTVSPAVSPHRNSKLAENSIGNHSGDQKQLPCDDAHQESGQSTKITDTDGHINVGGVSIVDEECGKLGDIKTESLPQTMEDCLKSNGTTDSKVATATLSASQACTTERSKGDLGAESIDKKVFDAKEETENGPLVTSQGLVDCLEEDKVRVPSLNDYMEKKAHQNAAVGPPNDDDEKSNASPELQSNILLEKKSVPVGLQSDPMHTNKKLAMATCGTGEHLTAVNSNGIKPENIRSVNISDLAGLAGKGIVDKESDSSFVPEKQGEPRVCCADGCQDSGCNNQNVETKEAPVQLSSSSAAQLSSAVALPETELLSAAEMTKSAVEEEKSKEFDETVTENVVQLPALGALGADSMLGFDLNEGFVDEGKNDDSVDMGACSGAVCSISSFQIHGSSTSCSLPASITVAAAAKGSFVPPNDLLWNKQELGWKGSAATSAFRPAEPRKVLEMPLGPNKSLFTEAPALRPARFPLDIDLNVADESSGQESDVRNDPVCEVMTTSLHNSGGFDLDLNKFDEAPDMTFTGQQMASIIQRVEVSAQHINPSALNAYSNDAASGKRDFDLNNGPVTEESPVEQLQSNQYNRGNISYQPSMGLRANSSDTRNCFSWYAPGTSYSVSVTPSALPDREAFSIVGIGGGPQRVMGGPTSTLSFNPDAYRGSVLSSSPALPFQPPPFQYPVLPYGSSFPLSTPVLAGGSSGYTDPAANGRIPVIPSQLVGNTAAVSFQYPHAYVVSRSIPDVGNNSIVESSHKFGKKGLDLNSGPGVLDVEGREESLQTVARQVSTYSSQSHADDQARMHRMGGGHPKRKEPDGGWNVDNLNFKQSSWR